MLSAQKVLNSRGWDKQPGEINAFQDTQGCEKPDAGDCTHILVGTAPITSP